MVKEGGGLWKKPSVRYPYHRYVPSRQTGWFLVYEAHELCGHGGMERIGRYVSKHYFIPNMYEVFKEVKDRCPVCASANPSFVPSPMLHPTEIGPAPALCYAIDLAPD